MVAALATLPQARDAEAQVFELRGGSSSLQAAHGGGLEIYHDLFRARVDTGYLGGFQLGFRVTTELAGVQWGVGDHDIGFELPADLFTAGHYFKGRGVSAALERSRDRLDLFIGASTSSLSTAFLETAHRNIDSRVAVVAYQRQLTEHLKLVSRTLLAQRQTSLHALRWQPRPGLGLVLAGGLGNNAGRIEVGADVRNRWASLKGAYAWAEPGFRRLAVEAPMAAEAIDENLLLRLTPRRSLSVTLTHQNLLDPGSAAPHRGTSTLDGLGVAARRWGTSFHANAYRSTTSIGTSSAYAAGARRNVSLLAVALEYLRAAPARGAATTTWIGTLTERFSRHLELIQTATHSQDRLTLRFGGRLRSNLVSAGVEYQTLFVPFARREGASFDQVVVLRLDLQLPWGIRGRVSTQVTETGRVRYVAHGDGFLYGGGAPSRRVATRVALDDLEIRGEVVDKAGHPVHGAALRIGDRLVFSDSRGQFRLSVPDNAGLPLRVELDQFMFPGGWEMVSAPAEVHPVAPGSDAAVRVVIQRKRIR